MGKSSWGHYHQGKCRPHTDFDCQDSIWEKTVIKVVVELVLLQKIWNLSASLQIISLMQDGLSNSSFLSHVCIKREMCSGNESLFEWDDLSSLSKYSIDHASKI